MSTQRRCDIWKATDGKWYMLLGNWEHAWDDCDCTAYGPFENELQAEEELLLHSNPGGTMTYPSGEQPPPEDPAPPTTKSPRRFYPLR